MITDTIKSISETGVCFENTHYGTELRFDGCIAEYFERYYPGDKVYLKCTLTEGGLVIVDVSELRTVCENQDKSLEVNLYCFDEEYSHDDASVMLRINCDVECTNDVVHPEQKEFYLKAGKGTTKLVGLPAVSSMCGNKCVYTVEVINWGEHYVDSESRLIDIDDNNMRKNLYVRYLRDEDKANLKDIDFNFTSNISEITDNTVKFANGEVFLYHKKIEIALGNPSTVDEKMAELPNMLKEASGLKGTLHMENFSVNSGNATFTPKK